jgi:periplasmic divalent cation tolerance protein
MILIYITCKDKKQAKDISNALLEKKLVACTNTHPTESMYWWDNKIQEDKEVVIIAKTKEENFDKVKQAVKQLHSYDIPCILKIKAEANKEYDNWVNRESS